ncbi:MAG: SsrA-binding protein SmpB [Clostridia bacterium]|nr:SsrA-binding protein SmpB [Clostridia bacterium]
MEEKVICLNRVATHEYIILERIEAGIVLEGGEVKSARLGNAGLKDSFCHIHNGEIFVKNMHIALYDKAGAFNTKNSKRDRKLLIHKLELVKLNNKVSQKGLTLVPLKLYFKGSLIKLELGLCQGKHTYDKKKATMERDIKRLSERELKNYK